MEVNKINSFMSHHTVLTLKVRSNVTELIPKSCREQSPAIKSAGF